LVRTENLLAAGRLDTADFWDSKKDTLMAKEDWPVRLDGVFLPGYLDDLKQLIPQVKYHVIRTKFLGGDGWDSEELLREVKPYVDGAVFATDFHTLSNESEWERFAKLFSRTYQHPPDKVAALTYDAVSLVISGIGAGGIDADAMREYLSQVRGFRGASGTITFKGSGRANNGVAIYSVEGKRLATER
jgi:branched-chain amino acid transport system substrate-binding protein